MITNTGKSIMAKYLVGQTPAYASYIAIGCGAKPLSGLEFSVTNKAKTDDVATLTSANHGLSIGQVIDVIGVDEDDFDGTYEIESVTTNTVSYTKSGTDVVSASVSPVGKIYPNFKNKTRLDFETIRVPIISRGYVTEELDTTDEFGNKEKVSKIVLTAELPTPDRYEISEIGVFSAQGNSLASSSDSRTLYSFSSNEGWAYHSAETNTATSIPNITQKLDNGTSTNDIVNDAITVGGVLQPVFQAAASNGIFLSDYRTKRFEQPRFLDNAIFMSGKSAKIDLDINDRFAVDAEWVDGSENLKSNHIHLTNARANFDNNSVTDEIVFAFSVVSKDEDSELDDIPSNVRAMLEFTSTDAYGEGQYARLEVDLYDINVASEDLPSDMSNAVVTDLSKNRYFAISKKIEDLTKSSGFSWEVVKNVKVYVSVTEADGDPTDKYFVCLDGLRLENVSTQNPLYGMVGYTLVNNNENNQPRTVIKAPNSTNYVEFRFAVDV